MPTLAESATVAVNSHSVGRNTLKPENDGLNSKRVDSVGFGTALSVNGGAR
jgi:hypothetical protein